MTVNTIKICKSGDVINVSEAINGEIELTIQNGLIHIGYEKDGVTELKTDAVFDLEDKKVIDKNGNEITIKHV